MIRLTVELIPNGNEAKKRLLSKMEIRNISWGDDRWPARGDYSVQWVTDGDEEVSIQQRVIKDFPRLRYNVWALILQALATFNHKDLVRDGDTKALGG